MKNNKQAVIEKLKEKTNRSEEECIIINDVLENHFIIGHNNKEKIKDDFKSRLNMTEEEADALYNTCAEIIVTTTFKRN